MALLAVACSSSSKVSSESLVYIVTETNIGGDVKESKVAYSNEITLDSSVLRMARWSDSPGRALVEFIDGSLIKF